MTQVKRKGLKLGVMTEFTLFTKVKPGHEKAIREAIERSTSDPRRAGAIQAIGTLHEARWALFDNDRQLLFCSSFDGSWDKYIDDFATTYIATIFDDVFSHCEGYPDAGFRDPGAKDWFMANAQEAVAYVCSYPNASVKEIWKALTLERTFQKMLDNPEAQRALEQTPALKPLLEQAAT